MFPVKELSPGSQTDYMALHKSELNNRSCPIPMRDKLRRENAMKKYTKPELTTEINTDVNEPVYMACSGVELFSASASAGEYEHQTPELGRVDCVFHVSATTDPEPLFHYEGPLYFYYLFDQDVDVETFGGSFNIRSVSHPDDGHTLVIGSLQYTVQQGQSIGFGDLYCKVTPDAYTNVHTPKLPLHLVITRAAASEPTDR